MERQNMVVTSSGCKQMRLFFIFYYQSKTKDPSHTPSSCTYCTIYPPPADFFCFWKKLFKFIMVICFIAGWRETLIIICFYAVLNSVFQTNVHLKPQNMTWFGIRIFANVKKLKWVHTGVGQILIQWLVSL